MKHHLRNRFPIHVLTMPFIYGLVFPMALFDLCVELYHRICFPAYGIPYVKRSDYIRFDRHKLSYLPFYDKLNCAYCGYANGLTRFASAVAAETEKYWCGIKNKPGDPNYHEPEHHKDFLEYGDAAAFERFRKGAPKA